MNHTVILLYVKLEEGEGQLNSWIQTFGTVGFYQAMCIKSVLCKLQLKEGGVRHSKHDWIELLGEQRENRLSLCFNLLMSLSAGILSMVSRSDCYPATAGSGVMSRGCNTNLWTVFNFPLTAGTGKETGMWMRTLMESPRRKE